MNSYIVIVSPSYGGAEKRFFDIFTCLVRQGVPVKMIAPSSLVNQLKSDHPDRADALSALIPVEVVGRWSRIRFVRGFRCLLKTLPQKASYHYPLNCLWPLHLMRGDRVTMSVADCTSVPSLFSLRRTSIWAWISFFFVRRIDILSPAVHTALRTNWRRGLMTLTPGGTFLVPPKSTSLVRMPTVSFLGRLSPGKGLDDLFNVLPSIWERLKECAPPGFTFMVAGYGTLQLHVEQRVAVLARAGIPISFVGYAVADELLARTTILLSLQEVTNYPSRVVAESLMSGCAVIVRDTGDSRQFGDDLPGLVYCRAELDADELASQILILIARSQREPDFAERLRRSATTRFSSPHYIDYFRSIICH